MLYLCLLPLHLISSPSEPAGAVTCGTPLSPRLTVGEGDYHLCYGELGSRVCIVASEPVTGALSDWVEVPRNTALVVCREKAGVLNMLQTPITADGVHPRLEEVSRCVGG